MSKPLSTDLRDRIVRLVASGKSCRAAAAHFDVAPSTTTKLQQRYARTGSVEPARRGRPFKVGAWFLFLPRYSPDLNPIEMAFSAPGDQVGSEKVGSRAKNKDATASA